MQNYRLSRVDLPRLASQAVIRGKADQVFVGVCAEFLAQSLAQTVHAAAIFAYDSMISAELGYNETLANLFTIGFEGYGDQSSKTPA